MTISRRIFIAALALGATFAGTSLKAGVAVAADTFPSKPVRIVVAYPPGGAVDTIARKVAQKLSEQMGQQFVIENKPGASGTIGAREVARAQPDGYTLLAIDNTYAILPYVFNKLPWNHSTDLIPVTVSAFSPIMLVVGNKSRFTDLQQIADRLDPHAPGHQSIPNPLPGGTADQDRHGKTILRGSHDRAVGEQGVRARQALRDALLELGCGGGDVDEDVPVGQMRCEGLGAFE